MLLFIWDSLGRETATGVLSGWDSVYVGFCVYVCVCVCAASFTHSESDSLLVLSHPHTVLSISPVG